MRSKFARETMEDVLPNIGIPLSRVSLGARDAFKEAPNAGVGVQGLGRSAAVYAQEVESLTDEILDILEGDK